MILIIAITHEAEDYNIYVYYRKIYPKCYINITVLIISLSQTLLTSGHDNVTRESHVKHIIFDSIVATSASSLFYQIQVPFSAKDFGNCSSMTLTSIHSGIACAEASIALMLRSSISRGFSSTESIDRESREGRRASMGPNHDPKDTANIRCFFQTCEALAKVGP
jgi:hypothetical protein